MTSPVSVSVQSPDEQAFRTIVDHHASLSADLSRLTAELRAAVNARAAHEPALAALREFVAGRLLPHAAAEEAALYPAAAGVAGARLLVEAMLLEHSALTELSAALARPGADVHALAAAERVVAVFTVHLRKENELLLPVLSYQPGMHLAALVLSMEEFLAAAPASQPAAPAQPPAELDVRALPHGAGRHEPIFAQLAELSPGGQLVITNDHDPRPLRYQIDAAWPGTFDWEYLQAGPDAWRVGITRRV